MNPARQVIPSMSNRILPILLAVVLILSGCLGGDGDPAPGEDGDPDTDPGSSGGGGGQGSGSGGGPGDDDDGNSRDLEALLSANVTSGDAPLYVNLTLNATGAQGDVSWALEFGDNSTDEGDTLPVTVAHVYEEAGNYTVTLTASIDDQSAEANLTITVEGPAAPEPNEVQEGSNSDCLDAILLYLVPGTQSSGAVEVEVEPGTRWEGTASEGRMTVDFYRDNDSRIENQVGGGTVPDEAEYGLVCVRMDTGPAPAQGAAWTYQDGLLPEEE